MNRKLTELNEKKVYSECGTYIGNIEEVLIKNNRVENVKIILDRKLRFDYRGVIIKYLSLLCVGDITILNHQTFKEIALRKNEHIEKESIFKKYYKLLKKQSIILFRFKKNKQ